MTRVLLTCFLLLFIKELKANSLSVKKEDSTEINSVNDNSKNTFYVKKLNDDNVKLVLLKNDKVKLQYISSSREKTVIKGVISKIEKNTIFVNNQPISIDKILAVTSNGSIRIILGSIGALAGLGIIAGGMNSLSKNVPGDVGSGSGSGFLLIFNAKRIVGGVVLIIVGAGVTAVSLVAGIIPSNYKVSKFSFNTYIE